MIAAVKISDSIQKGADAFFAFLPNLLAFLVILIIGYFVAKLIAGIIRRALRKLGVDRALHESSAGEYVERVSPDASPAGGISKVAFWLIFVFVLTAAIGALKIPAVTAFMNQVLAYLPNVIAAIVIFVVAAAVAGAAGGAAAKLLGDTGTGKVVATIVPTIVLVIGLFMVLNQLKIAPQIVTVTFTVLLGSLGLGLALAFGLGGRGVASRLLEDAYGKGQDKKDEVKRDVELGKDRAEDRAEEGRQRVEQQPRPAEG